jgi:hypothetical protein
MQPQAPWLVAKEHHGTAAIQSVYQEVLKGSSDPRTGKILTF